ncbi:hypothetical protein D918_01863, partial [Trichuris suis]
LLQDFGKFQFSGSAVAVQLSFHVAAAFAVGTTRQHVLLTQYNLQQLNIVTPWSVPPAVFRRCSAHHATNPRVVVHAIFGSPSDLEMLPCPSNSFV